MTAVPSLESGLITSKDDLIAYAAQGCKPKTAWRIGTEHEKFPFFRHTLKSVPYMGKNGIKALLQALHKQYGWQPVYENEQPIALLRDGAAISLEPAGQLELSGAPLETVHQTHQETARHLEEVKTIGAQLGIDFLAVGFHPTATRADQYWMPKGRYAIMKTYMPTRGTLGLDMMLRTITIQANLDYGSEADMVRKFRASLALQPIATLLFANSPFVEGTASGYRSYRAHVWDDTDPDRCGFLDFVFDSSMSFERYVDYLLDVPMYFVYRKGRYINAAGQSFRHFMAGRLPALPGERPTLSDWADHLSTAFPDVRMKRFLEMRGADGGSFAHICALPAFWVGLLYDDRALDAALDCIRPWSVTEMKQLRAAVPREGFNASINGQSIAAVAAEVLAIARGGLQRRAHLNALGADESIYLDVLNDTVRQRLTPADKLLSRQTDAADWRWLFTEQRY